MTDSLPRIKGSEVGESREPAVISDRHEREPITSVFYDAKGERHEYAYTAVGFAYERVDAMLDPGRRQRERRFE